MSLFTAGFATLKWRYRPSARLYPARTHGGRRLGSLAISTQDLWPWQQPFHVGSVRVMPIDWRAMSIRSEPERWIRSGSVALGRLVANVDGQSEMFSWTSSYSTTR
ncbi:hypothetical protein C1S80_07030 [Mycolicibacterium aubagnense]|nr:hypothetical protein C1S80_07030 [Mycolicibacterium aubagnense]